MSQTSTDKALQSTFGAIECRNLVGDAAIDTFPVTGTAPITDTGVLTVTLGTTPTKLLGKATTPNGRFRMCKLLNLTGAGTGIAYVPQVPRVGLADPTTITATGAATDGSRADNGETFVLPDYTDLWVVASAAGTKVQLTVAVR